MSLTIFCPGALAAKFLLRMFSATGRLWREFVVTLYFLRVLDRMPFSRRMRSTRLWLIGAADVSFNFLQIFLLP